VRETKVLRSGSDQNVPEILVTEFEMRWFRMADRAFRPGDKMIRDISGGAKAAIELRDGGKYFLKATHPRM